VLEATALAKTNVTAPTGIHLPGYLADSLKSAQNFLVFHGYVRFSIPKLTFACCLLKAIQQGLVSGDVDAVGL